MTNKKITIRVETETAKAFESLSVQERQNLELLLSLKLKESLSNSYSLLKIMDEMSQEAMEKGLTPKVLESLLADE